MTMLRILGVAFAASLSALACSDDHGDDGHGHDDLAAECQAIVDACHYKDDGTPGELNDCHATAHDEGTKAACEPIQERCISLCNAAPRVDGADAGAGYEI